MAKKDFGTMKKSENLKGGLSQLFNEPVETGKNEKETEEPESSIKTFSMFNDDHIFLNKYVLYRGFHSGEKYTQRKAINDALNLLREKYPDVEK